MTRADMKTKVAAIPFRQLASGFFDPTKSSLLGSTTTVETLEQAETVPAKLDLCGFMKWLEVRTPFVWETHMKITSHGAYIGLQVWDATDYTVVFPLTYLLVTTVPETAHGNSFGYSGSIHHICRDWYLQIIDWCKDEGILVSELPAADRDSYIRKLRDQGLEEEPLEVRGEFRNNPPAPGGQRLRRTP